jgi:thioredoxin reductase
MDVIIIGGSYAGLSAALALGRSRRHVLVIDEGLSCNRFTPHSQNFLTQDGTPPDEIRATALAQLQKYPSVHFLKDRAKSVDNDTTGFKVSTHSGTEHTAARLLLATGIEDILPELPGFRACWGKTIIHCPYCHGYEFRDKKTALWAPPEKAMHLAGLVKNLSADLTVLTDGLNTENTEKLGRNNITLSTRTLTSIQHTNGRLNTLEFSDGHREDFEVMYAALPFRPQTDIPEKLGCAYTAQGYVEVDSMQKTTVPGAYACGDLCHPMRSVANAVYTGNMAGAAINMDLTLARF